MRRIRIQELQSVALEAIVGRPLTRDDRDRWEASILRESKLLRAGVGARTVPLGLGWEDGVLMLKATGIAGSVVVRNTEIEVAPKYVASPDSDWIADLFAMIERVRPSRNHFARSTRLRVRPTSFADHIAFQYAAALASAVREEPVRQYRSREELLPQLRGRLLLARQLRTSFSRPHLLECEVDYLDTDNPTNHLLQWAGRRLMGLTIGPRVRRYLEGQMAALPPVAGSLRLPAHLTEAVPAQYRHYSEAVGIAVRLARGQRAGPEGGRAGTGLAVGMERLFETFVERSLAAALGLVPRPLHVVPQDVKPFALPVTAPDRKYYTRPDNVVYDGKTPVLLIDAKYKRFSEADETGPGDRPVNADLYQMAASLVAHGCSKAILVYPRTAASGEHAAGVRWWSVRLPVAGNLLIGAASLNLNGLSVPGAMDALDASIATVLTSALAATAA